MPPFSLLTYSGKLRVSNRSPPGYRFHPEHLSSRSLSVTVLSVVTRSLSSSDRTRSQLRNFSCSSTLTDHTTPRYRRAASLRQIIFVLTLSAQNKAMAPINFLAVIAWLVIMTLAGTEAQRQKMRLMTRPSDGAALCATDDPTLSTTMSAAMPAAPGVVRCATACTNDGRCKHFNYVANELNRCQLYHNRPTNFEVVVISHDSLPAKYGHLSQK